MSDAAIFVIGLLTSLLLGGGLVITFFEIRRIERETPLKNGPHTSNAGRVNK
jgi:hypothetical protein